MGKHSFIMMAGLAALLGGCSLAPKYTRPEPPIPSQLPHNQAKREAAPGQEESVPAEMGWREFFPDKRLQQVIELALDNNRDLRVAALNINKARALYRIQRSEQLPTVGATAGGSRQEMVFDNQSIAIEQYTVGLGVTSWELDIFGRIRSLKEAALQQFFATRYARSATRISLVAAVAESYMGLAADAESLDLARSILAATTKNFELIQRSYQLGVASELDLRQAKSQMEAAMRDVDAYEAQVATDRHALDLLVGATVPENLAPESLASVRPPRDISAGLSSEVLLQRPDILMAESQLKAMNANIGAARAAFFPRIALTGDVGRISSELSGLFDSGTGTWNVAAQAVLPIFTGGANRANLAAAKVDRDIAVARYEKAIQTAFREVSDALSLRQSLDKQLRSQQALTNALAKSYSLSDARYKQGIDSYLGVLISQQSLDGARQGLVRLRLARLVNLVELYKALGGGDLEQSPPDEPRQAEVQQATEGASNDNK